MPWNTIMEAGVKTVEELEMGLGTLYLKLVQIRLKEKGSKSKGSEYQEPLTSSHLFHFRGKLSINRHLSDFRNLDIGTNRGIRLSGAVGLGGKAFGRHLNWILFLPRPRNIRTTGQKQEGGYQNQTPSDIFCW